jgi:hypothetical protein
MTDMSPDLFIDAVLAYQPSAAIKAAVELDPACSHATR